MSLQDTCVLSRPPRPRDLASLCFEELTLHRMSFPVGLSHLTGNIWDLSPLITNICGGTNMINPLEPNISIQERGDASVRFLRARTRRHRTRARRILPSKALA